MGVIGAARGQGGCSRVKEGKRAVVADGIREWAVARTWRAVWAFCDEHERPLEDVGRKATRSGVCQEVLWLPCAQEVMAGGGEELGKTS